MKKKKIQQRSLSSRFRHIRAFYSIESQHTFKTKQWERQITTPKQYYIPWQSHGITHLSHRKLLVDSYSKKKVLGIGRLIQLYNSFFIVCPIIVLIFGITISFAPSSTNCCINSQVLLIICANFNRFQISCDHLYSTCLFFFLQKSVSLVSKKWPMTEKQCCKYLKKKKKRP
jgi:hypothetical protein